MMLGMRYEPEYCSHEHADVEYVKGQEKPRIIWCPDCGLKDVPLPAAEAKE